MCFFVAAIGRIFQSPSGKYLIMRAGILGQSEQMAVLHVGTLDPSSATVGQPPALRFLNLSRSTRTCRSSLPDGRPVVIVLDLNVFANDPRRGPPPPLLVLSGTTTQGAESPLPVRDSVDRSWDPPSRLQRWGERAPV